ncbi:pantoate--beta-alanine ligase [Neptuniibacter sp. CAU 1671]|uniref:pantoate--beta-alanine ligase n=1 Tax=Neptuniibacter sp. CAU 1671 TaxID=3032593 RepID=UPI0023DB9B4E|nr:pantoate--beta-alanine ligase [Neptuniibacter sp. CAU 1671]MDF2182306.1 pantoate--beta-alanine ligase [Neptuniibacter sp. CAU 1671]
MKTLHSIQALRDELAVYRRAGKKIGLVPTMGNLHEGHLQLIDLAKQHADIVVATIFVNPLQFGAGEDLDKYPRTLADDQDKLTRQGCDFLFAPTEDEMYPNGRSAQTQVSVPAISDLHCGASRPGHFTGVATVVCKLFGIAQPDVAVFGEKDYQQLMVIRQMAADLCIPVNIVGAPIARNADGLALSSRNGYLSDDEKARAIALRATLNQTAQALKAGEKDFARLQETAQQQLETQGFRRDYYMICRQTDLQPATATDNKLVILAAAHMGPARLIDNLEVSF